MTLVDDVAARVRTQVTGLTVYEHAVPRGVVPDRYVIVQSTSPLVDSTDFADSRTGRSQSVWLRTITTDQGQDDEQVAVRRCAWAAEKADLAVATWVPATKFLPRHLSASPAGLDDDQPDKIVAYAASIWAVRTA